MLLLQKPMFKRAYKKLYPAQKEIVDQAILKIMANPKLGEEKKQDLQGIFVYKFQIINQLYLLAYTFDPATLTLVMLGVHENFYRNLKR